MSNAAKLSKEDWELKIVLETNLRQRGVVGGSTVKMARRFRELQRLSGICNGGDRKSECHNGNLITQEELADKLGVSLRTFHRVKSLLDLIPEFQDMVDNELSPTIASTVIARLSEDEQRELLEMLPAGQKITAKMAEQYTAMLTAKEKEIASKEREIERKDAKIEDQNVELKRLGKLDMERENELRAEEEQEWIKKQNQWEIDRRKLYEEKESLRKEAKAKEEAVRKLMAQKVQTVVPDDYDDLKAQAAQAGKLRDEIERLQPVFDELTKAEEELERYKSGEEVTYPDDYYAIKSKLEEYQRIEADRDIMDVQNRPVAYSINTLDELLLTINGELFAYTMVKDLFTAAPPEMLDLVEEKLAKVAENANLFRSQIEDVIYNNHTKEAK